MTNEAAQPTAATASDPSMEEILASIRRILDDDEVPTVSADGTGLVPPDDDVLLLDESMMVPATEPTRPAPAEMVHLPAPTVPPMPDPHGPDDPVLESPVPEVSRTQEPGPAFSPATLPELIAPETAAAAASSVGTLVRTLAAGRATQIYGGGPTLEDMVRAELRPMLKLWLDEYLPPLVERLVRTEIERVVSRQVP